ncbi:MAG: DUF5686 and carboxypeptidase regulatory-like domain-containing protein [Bacteroidales bacterium]|nr:DUF5686 and carboxypeptidase regulatory-like domain-containing protein [Bacteroidales bacterium]
MTLLCAVGFQAQAQGQQRARVRVEVVDSVSGEPVPYAAVMLVDGQGGLLADDHGRALVFVNPDKDAPVQVQAMGYTTKTVVSPRGKNTLRVEMAPTGVALQEVTVKRKKEKYTKKNNPAVKFVESIRSAEDLTNPRRNPYYNYSKYERLVMAINDFNVEPDDWLEKKFPFLKEHVDTSEVSGRPILPLMVREKRSDIHYRHDPKSEKEVVTALQRAGVDDVMSNQENVQQMFEDVFREIDLYQNDITLLQNRFVSPLGRLATDFYKFYLTDTVQLGSERCIVLSFAPHNPAMMGFIGRVFVPENDTTMFIRRVEMRMPHSVNVNFLEALHITQDYERAEDGSRLKTRDDLTVEFKILPGTPGIYVRRSTAYRDHNFEPPEDTSIFDFLGKEMVVPEAKQRDEQWWEGERTIAMSRNEGRVDSLMVEFRQVPLYYWTEKTIKLFASGYVHMPKGKVEVGPIEEFISGNSVEGVRLQLGGLTTAKLSPRWFARGYGAWGTKDHKWKYSGELEYSFRDKEYHAREFPVQSIKGRYSYDVDEIGQSQSYYSNFDMLFSSFTRMKNNQMTYRRQAELEWVWELENNLSFTAGMRWTRQEATDLMPFLDAYGTPRWKYDQTTFDFQIRYAPGEKFYQGKTERLPLNMDAPVFTLRHTFGPKRLFGAAWTINRTEASVFKRIWLSAWGYVDCVVKGAHVWNQAPYPNLIIPAANITYLIQPETFPLLNPLEFVLDSYASWDITYWLNGALFNYIPYFKKLKLREVVEFRGFVGHLSMKNDPRFHDNLYRFPEISHTQELGHTPYMEAAVGIDNLLRIFRVDFVWRLTYRDNPGIDRFGVRASLHLTF